MEPVSNARVGGGTVADGVAGRDYVSTGVTGFELAPHSRILVSFPEVDRISIRAGCNGMFGQAVWDDATLTAPMLASTMMACDEALMRQDTFLSDLLSGGVEASLDGSVLTLTQGNVTIELTEQAAADSGGVPDPGASPPGQAG